MKEARSATRATAAKRSVYRDFITALRKAWRTQLPKVRPIKEALGGPFGPSMPKASTFYAGVSRSTGLHVFVNFQHSPKPWEAGRFTINLILSNCEGTPEIWCSAELMDDGASKRMEEDYRTEGDYRIGPLLGGKDKWWHLKRDAAPILTEAWRPTSYDNNDAVIAEAIADVTRDLRSVFVKLQVDAMTTADSDEAERRDQPKKKRNPR